MSHLYTIVNDFGLSINNLHACLQKSKMTSFHGWGNNVDERSVHMHTLHISNGYCCAIHDLQNKRGGKTGDKYIYHAYTLFSLSSTFSGYQKPRTTFLEEREDDEDILTTTTSSVHETVHEVPTGPMTRAKLINQQVLLFLNEFPIDYNENWLLPHANTLCILRFEHCEDFGANSIEETHRRSREVTFSFHAQVHDQVFNQVHGQVYDHT